MTVSSIINKNGRAVPNQFIITEFSSDNAIVKRIAFQSYDSLVCEIIPNCGMGFDCLIRFGRDYDYSNTTKRHLINFLQSYPVTSELVNMDCVRMAIEKGRLRNESIAVIYDDTMR